MNTDVNAQEIGAQRKWQIAELSLECLPLLSSRTALPFLSFGAENRQHMILTGIQQIELQ